MTEQVDAVNEYYREVFHGRIRNWHHSESLAIHFGLDQAGEDDSQAARLRLNAELMDHLLGRGVPEKHARLVDLGCGICGTAIDFVEQNPRWIVTAVSCDREMLDFGKEFIVQRGGVEPHSIVYRIDLVCADYQTVILSQGTHDAIYAIDSMCYSTDRSQLLDNLVPMLRPGGCLAVVDVFPVNISEEAFPHWVTFCEGWGGLSTSIGPELGKQMSDAGLVGIESVDWTERVSPAIKDLSDKAAAAHTGNGGVFGDHLKACRAAWWLVQHGAVRYGILSGVKPH